MSSDRAHQMLPSGATSIVGVPSVLTQTTRGLYAHVESRQRDDQKALQLRLVLLPAIVPAIVVFSAILHAIVFIQLLQLLVIKPQLSGQLNEHGAEDEEDLY